MLNKTELSDGFYRMYVNPDDAPKLSVVSPTNPGANPMVAVPLLLPIVWKNRPPAFSTATETIADIANYRLHNPNYTPPPHQLDHMAAEVLLPPKTMRPIALPPYVAIDIPSRWEPSLPTTGKPMEYTGIFVDDFIFLSQNLQLRSVHQTLLHTVDHVFCPLGDSDYPFRREQVSLKKLR